MVDAVSVTASAASGSAAVPADDRGAGDEASDPPVATVMIGVPTSTIAPSLTSRLSTTPVKGDGSSTSDFAVSISTSTWFTVTRSPGATFHDTISASVRPSPTSGSRNSSLLIRVS